MAASLSVRHEACAVCGAPYFGTRKRLTCSVRCKRARDNESRRAAYQADPARVCAEVAAWRAANPEKNRAIRRRYMGARDASGELRSGPCEIPSCPYVGALHLDHDHATGRVRGWLCPGCNTGLGKFGDSPQRLRDAANYLERE